MPTLITFSFLLILLLILSSPIPISSTHSRCNQSDKKALLDIKSSFNYPSHLASWTNTTPCCTWYGVGCDPATGRVVGLSIFQDNNLTGTIHSSVGRLPFLQSLTLHSLPNLVGAIPSSITKLTHLTLLDLSRNSLSGPIPTFLSELTSLTYLNLAFNHFSGSIPPSLSNLTNLRALHLDRNRLTGEVPDSFGNFTKSVLPDLYLSHNNLSGPIPVSLGGPEWGVIDLSRNRLTGDASVLFGSTKRTSQIDLSRNRFGFNLTNVRFPVSLTRLDLSHNLIYGGIPAQINEVRGLQRFNVSYNRLCGEIPAGSVTAHFGPDSYSHHRCLCGPPLMPCK